jgi:hypothetical protein
MLDLSILRHSGIRGAADEAVLNNANKKGKIKKIQLLQFSFMERIKPTPFSIDFLSSIRVPVPVTIKPYLAVAGRFNLGSDFLSQH